MKRAVDGRTKAESGSGERMMEGKREREPTSLRTAL